MGRKNPFLLSYIVPNTRLRARNTHVKMLHKEQVGIDRGHMHTAQSKALFA